MAMELNCEISIDEYFQQIRVNLDGGSACSSRQSSAHYLFRNRHSDLDCSDPKKIKIVTLRLVHIDQLKNIFFLKPK